jgi:hypothetical protein
MGEPREQQRRLMESLEREGEGYRLLLAGDEGGGREKLAAAAASYRRSWEAAPARAFGRLVGMLKAAILAGEPAEAAAYARRELGGTVDSPASCYALALAALIQDDDAAAAGAANGMRGGGDAFSRTAAAIDSLAAGDGERYRRALREIVADFEQREEHLTGVAIADTALVLQWLAERRGMAAEISSPLLPRQRTP